MRKVLREVKPERDEEQPQSLPRILVAIRTSSARAMLKAITGLDRVIVITLSKQDCDASHGADRAGILAQA